MFGIVFALIIIALGAALRYAVTVRETTIQRSEGEGVEGRARLERRIKLPTVGLIVMALGAALLIVSIITAIV